MGIPDTSAADERTHHLGVRMAAWHRTIVAVREETGNAGVSSQHSRGAHHTRMNYLAKLQVGVLGEGGAAAWFWDGEGHSVEDFPGGVATSFRAGETDVTARLAPLLEGRGVEPWGGAAAYLVSSSTGAPLVVRVGSVAEGEMPDVRVEGDRVAVRVREGLLAPYAAYGRLGAATFSRRSFFVRCEAEGMEFWLPVDVMVLPPVEAAAAREVVLEGEALIARVVLRNNRDELLAGTATLHVAGDAFTWPVALAARSEGEVAFRLPAGMAGVLSPGDNTARVVFPGGDSVGIMPSVTEPFREGVLREHAEARLQPIALPREDTVDATEWARFRPSSHGGPVPWPHWVQPLQGMEDLGALEATDIPGLRFEFEPTRWIVLGELGGRPFHRVELPEGNERKLHLLVAVFCDNHDMCSRLGTILLRDGHRVVASRELHMPGDVDWWEPNGMLRAMDILREGLDDRLGLAPLVGRDHATLNQATGGHDWSPPVFPRPPHWSRARFIKTPNCNFNIIDMDLGAARDARSLSIQMDGLSPALALVAVTAEMDRGHELLDGTPIVPPARHRRPTTLFSFRAGEALEGWALEGEAFLVASPWGITSLNSVAAAGEAATGTATSPDGGGRPRGACADAAGGRAGRVGRRAQPAGGTGGRDHQRTPGHRDAPRHARAPGSAHRPARAGRPRRAPAPGGRQHGGVPRVDRHRGRPAGQGGGLSGRRGAAPAARPSPARGPSDAQGA